MPERFDPLSGVRGEDREPNPNPPQWIAPFLLYTAKVRQIKSSASAGESSANTTGEVSDQPAPL